MKSTIETRHNLCVVHYVELPTCILQIIFIYKEIGI